MRATDDVSCRSGFPLLVCLLLPGAWAAEPGNVTVHRAPGPVPAGAVTSDWPRFLGPTDDATSPETGLIDSFGPEGPPLVWEVEKGDSYTCPSIVGDRLVLFDNVADTDRVDCRDPETGTLLWSHAYPCRYRDRYGYGTGPRASPVIADGRVFTLSATSVLHALDLATGAVRWKRDLGADYAPGPFFFGHGPTPLVHQGKVIVPLGGEGGVAVAAFDAATGETVWETRHEWPASYASPVLGTFHGEPAVLVFAGGDSDPPTGGLLRIRPDDGQLVDAFPWRSTKYESVNASTPVRLPGNRVLLSETYTEGAVLLEYGADGKATPVWTAPELKLHWMTPVAWEGHLYAFTGRNEPDAGLDAWNLATGERAWREEWFWKRPVGDRTFGWSLFRGSLLRADGKWFALGEMGTLAILDLTPEGGKIRCQAELFAAAQTWTLPALRHGLLYVVQNQRDLATGAPPRLRCYDLRRPEAGGKGGAG
jgi:outer membrane protein assembly factor BamB